ncbi:protein MICRORCHIDIA 4 [Sesbania bispinosa]|nr:protein MICRORCHIDIA 4 [Sesbania bispinosa]
MERWRDNGGRRPFLAAKDSIQEDEDERCLPVRFLTPLPPTPSQPMLSLPEPEWSSNAVAV